MTQRPSARSATAPQSELRSMLGAEAPTLLGIVSLAAISLFHGPLFADLHNYPLTALLFLWLFAAMLWCAFGVVRHAEVRAERLGEPSLSAERAPMCSKASCTWRCSSCSWR